MGWVIARLQQPWVQRAVRAAPAAGLSWQAALLLPPALLAAVVRHPYHATEGEPDARDAAIAGAVAAADRLTALLRTSGIGDDEGFFALGAVTVGMHHSLQTLEAHVRFPQPVAADR